MSPLFTDCENLQDGHARQSRVSEDIPGGDQAVFAVAAMDIDRVLADLPAGEFQIAQQKDMLSTCLKTGQD